MKIIKKLFGKKKDIEEESSTDTNKKEIYNGKEEYCPHCGLEMVEGVHQTRILQGKRFHKLCSRELLKQAKKQAFG